MSYDVTREELAQTLAQERLNYVAMKRERDANWEALDRLRSRLREIVPDVPESGDLVAAIQRKLSAPSPPETPAAEGNVDRSCTATLGPDEDDPHVYVCDRKATHTTLHSTGPEGEEIAWWCSCPDCARTPASPASAPRETPADAALRDRILAHLDAASLTKARLIVEGLWPARETPRARLRFCPGGPGHRSGVNALVEVEDCPACLAAAPPEAPASSSTDPATKEQS